jgi:3-oxoacyl-[acyl-carrier-protein] synthase-3
MNKLSAGITGVGAYLPEKILTNAEMEKIVDTSDEWIVARTGIRQRYVAAPHETTSDLAAHAARDALCDAGISVEQIDLILVATVTPDAMMPSTASQVQKRIGAVHAGVLDIEAACSGFVYGLTIAQQFILSGSMNHILVIGADAMTRHLDWNDRKTCILFGDGAGAAVVSRAFDGNGLLDFYLGADGSVPKEWLMLGGNGSVDAQGIVVKHREAHLMMNGTAVYKFGVEILPHLVNTVLQKSHLSLEAVDLIIPHQGNKRIIESAAERLNVHLSKFYINIDKRANTSAASIPIAMVDARQDGRFKEGDTVVLAAFGAGFTWAGIALRY